MTTRRRWWAVATAAIALGACTQSLKLTPDDSKTVLSQQLITAPNPGEPGPYHVKYLTYGKYIYGNHTKSPLTEFKRRNGFQPTLVPRYYIPLTFKGRVAMALGLHLSFKRFIPEKLHYVLGNLRSRWYQRAASGASPAEERERAGETSESADK